MAYTKDIRSHHYRVFNRHLQYYNIRVETDKLAAGVRSANAHSLTTDLSYMEYVLLYG